MEINMSTENNHSYNMCASGEQITSAGLLEDIQLYRQFVIVQKIETCIIGS